MKGIAGTFMNQIQSFSAGPGDDVDRKSSGPADMIAIIVSGILVLMIMYFLYDSGSSQRLNPEYRKLNNIMYEA